MAQKKAHEVEAWLARPHAETSIVLIYGPDRGLVSEQAERYARATGLPLDDPFTVVKLEASTLEKEAGRLVHEVNAIAMFAPRRLLWVRGAGPDKRLAEEIKIVAAQPEAHTILLIEAGELKKGSALRAVIESAPAAMALPCYPDEDRDLDRLLEQELGNAAMRVDNDARLLLKASLGGDRLATRGELHKLVLYAAGQKSISVADVRAAVSDVAQDTIDDVINAVLIGDTAFLDTSLVRAMSSPTALYPIISAMMRRLLQLHLLRAEVENGKTISAVVAGARPPVMFQQKALIERALQSWSLASIESATSRLHHVTLQTRKRSDLAAATLRQCLLSMAQRAKPRQRG